MSDKERLEEMQMSIHVLQEQNMGLIERVAELNSRIAYFRMALHRLRFHYTEAEDVQGIAHSLLTTDDPIRTVQEEDALKKGGF
jgi:uncharacterized small protein (DUF1192 family)